MLLHPAYRILAAVLPLVALSSASGSNDTSNAALWNIIPDCAKTCVENFIQGQYTSNECSSAEDIKCLCRTKTAIGLTLGEAALSCLYALCSEKDISSKGNSVYHVCDSVSGAIRETHATITATTFDPPSSTTTSADVTTSVSTTSGNTSQTRVGSSTSSLPTSTTSVTTSSDSGIVFQTTSSASGVVSATTSAESISTTPSDTATSSPSNDGSSNHVSSGTVIGVSVASGVAGSFIIGVAVFFCCKRWKQRNRTIRSNSDHDFFEIGGAMSQPPGFSRPSSRHSSPSPEPNPTGPSSFGHTVGHQEVSELPCTRTPTAQNLPATATVMLVPNTEKPREKEPIGVAVSSGDEWESSPRTLSSQHTLAEPIAPQTTGLYPKPLKWSHRPVSGETLFEEDEFQQSRQSGSQTSESQHVMTGLPANPRALKNGFPAQKYLRPPPQRLYPGQTSSTSSAQAVPSERALVPAFSTTAPRGSPPSNPSSTPHNSSGSSHRNSANTLLTPFSTGQGRILSGMSTSRPNPAQTPSPRQLTTMAGRPCPGPATPVPPSNGLGLTPTTEIVSRPRIVRRDDIKRVQIRSSPRPPSEVVVPYCPEDFWIERGRSRAPSSTASTGLPYPSEAFPGAVLYPRSPQRRPQDVNEQRLSATGRSLTPSRRGQDLILRVD
ncbi:uncharacterized protein N7496_001313 [Penicillium cataractarum]|uniref:CFEM domain-containing protein n=1 Tax=Penicillium cataractarum TaxID=2100454 RepID=A0A9X0B6T3_9EURO|nr:uncharacterized protein N7496_001313 [Penicillium cataractarum]KAJ5390245.1 hypothetical protein N7496_001313 [Penicillium cataractarum]